MIDESFIDAHSAECEALDAEKLRQVYVAVTRAQNALIVCAPYKVSSKGKESAQASMWDCVSENLADFSRFMSFQDETEYDVECASADNNIVFEVERDKASNKDKVIRASAKYLYDQSKEDLVFNKLSNITHPTYSILQPSKADDEENSADFSKDKKETDAKKPRFNAAQRAYFGTLIHRVMEILISNRHNLEAIDKKDLVSFVVSEHEREDTHDLHSVAQTILLNVIDKMLDGGFEQENGVEADIFSQLKSANKIYCEVPFRYAPNSEPNSEPNNEPNSELNIENSACDIVSGVIDLVYETKGSWHILDWKTNASASSLDEIYALQLKLYKQALEQMCGIHASAHTYHIDIT